MHNSSYLSRCFSIYICVRNTKNGLKYETSKIYIPICSICIIDSDHNYILNKIMYLYLIGFDWWIEIDYKYKIINKYLIGKCQGIPHFSLYLLLGPKWSLLILNSKNKPFMKKKSKVLALLVYRSSFVWHNNSFSFNWAIKKPFIKLFLNDLLFWFVFDLWDNKITPSPSTR